jgi:hypothetical protein
MVVRRSITWVSKSSDRCILQQAFLARKRAKTEERAELSKSEARSLYKDIRENIMSLALALRPMSRGSKCDEFAASSCTGRTRDKDDAHGAWTWGHAFSRSYLPLTHPTNRTENLRIRSNGLGPDHEFLAAGRKRIELSTSRKSTMPASIMLTSSSLRMTSSAVNTPLPPIAASP